MLYTIYYILYTIYVAPRSCLNYLLLLSTSSAFPLWLTARQGKIRMAGENPNGRGKSEWQGKICSKKITQNVG